MNWEYMICVEMYGNGQKHQPIRMLRILSLKAIFSFVVEEVGGMKRKNCRVSHRYASNRSKKD